MTDLDLLPERGSDGSFPDLAIRLGVAMLHLVLGLDKFSSSPGSHWVVLFRHLHAGSWFRYVTGLVGSSQPFHTENIEKQKSRPAPC
jgi:hypothetical protein